MLFFANIAGMAVAAFKWIVSNWRLLAIVGGAVGLLIVFGLVMRSCNERAAKIDIKTVDKINKANETEKLKELEKTIVENQSVINTVDERNKISDLNETEKQAAIWAKVQEVNQKILDSKTQGRDVTGAELECMLTGSCK